MENIKFATIKNGVTITLEFNNNDGYVYAVYENVTERLECDGTFADVDSACETMERLYRADEWNFTRI